MIMSANLIRCTGSYATTPYYYKTAELNIWSIEQLCYYFIENSCWLDSSIIQSELVDWIGIECKLPDMAKELRKTLHKKGALEYFVRIILDNVDYVEQDQVGEVLTAIRCQSGMDEFAVEKQRADFFLKKGQTRKAIGIYRELIRCSEENGKAVKSSIVHNLGVAYATLFEFAKASECFLDAFLHSNDKEEYLAYLATMRLQMTEDEYVNFVATKVAHYNLSIEFEHQMSRLVQEYEGSHINGKFQETCNQLRRKNTGEYKEYLDEKIQEMKIQYKKNEG